jgi:hypothetical protein
VLVQKWHKKIKGTKVLKGNTGIFIYGLMVTALVGQLVYKKPKKYGWYTCGKICNEHYKLRRHLMKVYIFIDYSKYVNRLNRPRDISVSLKSVICLSQ